MIKKYTSKNITWVDMEEPNRREIKSLMEEYKIHPLVAEELLTATFRPTVDLYDNFIYLVLHFPTLNHSTGSVSSSNLEIDFVIGKDFFITTRYGGVNLLQKTSKIFEIENILNEETRWEHGGFLFYYVVQQLYKNLIEELDYLEGLQEEMEADIFGGNEKKMVKKLSQISHNLLDFKQATMHHRGVLDLLEKIGSEFFGKEFSHYLKDINNKYRKISHIININIENLKELRTTNDSLLTTKQNEAMKIVAILAFTTFPLSLIAAIFGMNTSFLPIVGIKGDFWIIIGGMLVLTFGMFLFFRHKKWL